MSIDHAPARGRTRVFLEPDIEEEPSPQSATRTLSQDRYVALDAIPTSEVVASTAAKMAQMLAWEDDWDGHGSSRIHLQTTWAALKFLAQNAPRISTEPHLHGTSDGGVVAAWQHGGFEAELTFEPGEPAHAYFADLGSHIEWEGPASDAPGAFWQVIQRSGALA